MNEPLKNDVLGYRPGAQVSRQAFSVILDRKHNRTFEAVVDLKTERVLSWTEVKSVQPFVMDTELDALSDIVTADARWQAAMRKRGIEDFKKVQIDGWAVGQVAAKYRGMRLLRALSYFKGDSINFYGQPIEGVVALVNMNTEQVVEVVDTGVVPLAPPSQQLDEKSTGTREAPKPLTLTQPAARASTSVGRRFAGRNGASATRCTRAKVWCYTPSGTKTGDACAPSCIVRRSPRWSCRTATRVKTGGGGTRSTWANTASVAWPVRLSQRRMRPENATLLDVTFAGDDGQPVRLERAVGIYERDGGLLWKHYESYSEQNESRRARQLVIFFIATIGNYDYAVHWIFHQDGVLEADAALTGIMLPKGVQGNQGRRARHEHQVRPSCRGQRRRAASPALLQLPARLRRGRAEQLRA